MHVHNVVMDNKLRKEYVKLHISVVLAAFTGILGKLINLNALLLVWYVFVFHYVLYSFAVYKKSAAREFKGMFKDMQSWGAFGTAFFILFCEY